MHTFMLILYNIQYAFGKWLILPSLSMHENVQYETRSISIISSSINSDSGSLH